MAGSRGSAASEWTPTHMLHTMQTSCVVKILPFWSFKLL